MQILSILMGLAAAGAPASTPDWRFVSVSGDSGAVMFVDLASIATTPNDHREAEIFFVTKEDNGDGVAGMRARIEIDCPGHRQRKTHLWTLNASNGPITDGDIDEAWFANTPKTPGEDIEKYICTRGASYAEAASVGSTVPIGKIREILTRRSTGK